MNAVDWRCRSSRADGTCLGWLLSSRGQRPWGREAARHPYSRRHRRQRQRAQPTQIQRQRQRCRLFRVARARSTSQRRPLCGKNGRNVMCRREGAEKLVCSCCVTSRDKCRCGSGRLAPVTKLGARSSSNDVCKMKDVLYGTENASGGSNKMADGTEDGSEGFPPMSLMLRRGSGRLG